MATALERGIRGSGGVVLLSLGAWLAGCGTSQQVQAPPAGATVIIPPAIPVAVEPPDEPPPPEAEPRHPVPAPGLDATLFRDPRRPPRALPLLVVEIQQLEALAHATAAGAPDRTAILRRLAEDYVELEKAATAESLVPGDPARREVKKRTAEHAHQEAIRDYEASLAASSAASSAGTARSDEATYFLAYERERAGDLAGARRGYLDLITKSPNSRYVPMAYLAFGELFAAEALDDPSKWELAKQAFLKVLTTPPPNNAVYGYAWYRLGYVLVNAGDRDGALHALDKAIEAATAFPQLPGSSQLLDEAQGQRRSLSPTAPASP
jgi:tetratricopeptide (TPR) repeat protein